MKRASRLRVAVAGLVLAGCALTQPVKRAPESGFLTDYARLHKGNDHQAELVYVRPDVQWKRYDKMLLDPVTIWRSVNVGSKGVSQQDAQAMADYFYSLSRPASPGPSRWCGPRSPIPCAWPSPSPSSTRPTSCWT